jgi:hypothetical protein
MLMLVQERARNRLRPEFQTGPGWIGRGSELRLQAVGRQKERCGWLVNNRGTILPNPSVGLHPPANLGLGEGATRNEPQVGVCRSVPLTFQAQRVLERKTHRHH